VSGELLGKSFLLIVIILAAPAIALAQQAGVPHRVGVLMYDGAPPGLLEAFRAGLRDRGYVEGRNITLQMRNAEGKPERLGALANELLALKVEVILAVNTPAAKAAKEATTTVPIVIMRVANPLKSGLVANLARPEGNVTGVSLMHTELTGKRIELLKEILPGISRLAVLSNVDNPGHTPQVAEMKQVCAQMGLDLLSVPVHGRNDLPRAFQEATRARAEAFVVLDDTSLTNDRDLILKLAALHALPVVARYKDFADAGALLAYGPSLPALYRRAAYYIDEILKGTKPSNLPIEQPMYFDLVLNLKTAKALGLTIPESVLIRADDIIK
jgi:ABC-type uncharacterized transport system substrate-binding protein